MGKNAIFDCSHEEGFAHREFESLFGHQKTKIASNVFRAVFQAFLNNGFPHG